MRKLKLKSILCWMTLCAAACIIFTSCTPYYTWGYAPSIHPEATQAYIYAVMARENGDYEMAIHYYDIALRRTYSDKVARERAEVAEMMK